MHLEVADVKNAFCQGREMRREGGRLYVEPCDGLELAPGSLIELNVPVYGLIDAPLEWHKTVTEELTSLGFRKCLLEPCWWTRRGSGGVLQMVMIEVDDFLIGSVGRDDMHDLKDQLSARFQFGKYREIDESGAEFAGRRVRCLHDRVTVDQEKYILEELQPMPRTPKASLFAAFARGLEFCGLKTVTFKNKALALPLHPPPTQGLKFCGLPDQTALHQETPGRGV